MLRVASYTTTPIQRVVNDDQVACGLYGVGDRDYSCGGCLSFVMDRSVDCPRACTYLGRRVFSSISSAQPGTFGVFIRLKSSFGRCPSHLLRLINQASIKRPTMAHAKSTRISPECSIWPQLLGIRSRPRAPTQLYRYWIRPSFSGLHGFTSFVDIQQVVLLPCLPSPLSSASSVKHLDQSRGSTHAASSDTVHPDNNTCRTPCQLSQYLILKKPDAHIDRSHQC